MSEQSVTVQWHYVYGCTLLLRVRIHAEQGEYYTVTTIKCVLLLPTTDVTKIGSVQGASVCTIQQLLPSGFEQQINNGEL
jgi:hypothetical protein